MLEVLIILVRRDKSNNLVPLHVINTSIIGMSASIDMSDFVNKFIKL